MHRNRRRFVPFRRGIVKFAIDIVFILHWAKIFPLAELVELKLLLLSHFLQHSVIILVIFGTEGLYFAQRGSVFIMDTIILDILTKWSVMYFLGTNHAEGWIMNNNKSVILCWIPFLGPVSDWCIHYVTISVSVLARVRGPGATGQSNWLITSELWWGVGVNIIYRLGLGLRI